MFADLLTKEVFMLMKQHLIILELKKIKQIMFGLSQQLELNQIKQYIISIKIIESMKMLIKYFSTSKMLSFQIDIKHTKLKERKTHSVGVMLDVNIPISSSI